MTITYIILAVTIGISLFAMNNEEIKNRYMFNAYAISRYREWWRFFSHSLLHANFFHLLFNMYALYGFGGFVEPAFKVIFGPGMGTLFYVLLYVGALFASSIYDYFKHKDDSYYNALGASGAVMAVIFTAILLHPVMPMGLLFIPVQIPAVIFGILIMVVSLVMARRSVGNIAHAAHFWGAAYGFILPIVLKPELLTMFMERVKMYFVYGIVL